MGNRQTIVAQFTKKQASIAESTFEKKIIQTNIDSNNAVLDEVCNCTLELNFYNQSNIVNDICFSISENSEIDEKRAIKVLRILAPYYYVHILKATVTNK